MKFHSAAGIERPIRLSEETRLFAWESLNARYGKEVRATPAVEMDHIPGFSSLPSLDQYDSAIREIVIRCPVRLCPGERISGAATLGKAIEHAVPATHDGVPVCGGVSHLTPDFGTAIAYGVDDWEQRLTDAYARQSSPRQARFLQSMVSSMESLHLWHARYLDALEKAAALDPIWVPNRDALRRVPFQPARTFGEAVQSLWFLFAFTRLCGNWPGIGRIDVLLGRYLHNDLAHGLLTLDEAREILAHFFIKGCEWICGEATMKGGDAQHYQNIVLGGIDENGNDVTNEATFLVLDIIEELGISDFPISVRVNRDTSPALLKRMGEVIRHGGGVIAVYGEETVLRALMEQGYSERDARRFANDGCWEVQVPGETYFCYLAFDSLRILQANTLNGYNPDQINFDSFEMLYQNYLHDLELEIKHIAQERLNEMGTQDAKGRWQWRPQQPCTVISLFVKGCLEKLRSYLEGGPIYNVVSPHIGGLPDTVNSLYALKKLVYEEKKIALRDFLDILNRNWDGEESLRHYVYSHYDYYGNDNDEVDRLAVRLLDDFANICESLGENLPIRFPAGVSTFGRQIEWAPARLATPSGRKRGEILAANLSPTPGNDTKGATAVIRSYCKNHLEHQGSGAALDLCLLSSIAGNASGAEAIQGLIRGFVLLGGFFLQIDVSDPETLLRARAHPEEYRTLAVRVSGWSARFVTLDEEWQQMIIERDLQGRLS